MGITLNANLLKDCVSTDEIKKLSSPIEKAHHDLHHKSGAGNDFLGWVDLPSRTEDFLIRDLENLANEVKEYSEAVISIGIGGSYLGILSTIEFLGGPSKLPIYYAGHNMSSTALSKIVELINTKDVSVVVISKSGATTEPALAFRIINQAMQAKYDAAEMKRRIICVTDAKKGALRQIADAKGYRSYIIPDDVGGRFSVLTPVGLVPLAMAGVDIGGFINGFRAGEKEYANPNVEENAAYYYAAARNVLYNKGKVIEMFASFYPNMQYVAEWWKQLYGESEGKEGKGIFPASTILSTDLHSMGQLMQEGMRNIFETFVMIEQMPQTVLIPPSEDDLDEFNCVANKDIDWVNKQAYQATAEAHYEGGVPNMTITLGQADAHHIGQLYYFYEKAVGISGYLLGVNPFDQPGVEAYKKKMFNRLGK